MKYKKGLVSIIMNCHNGEKYLKEAIQSVINQEYNNWELIFWNNNSSDNSEKIFKNFKDKKVGLVYSKYIKLNEYGFIKKKIISKKNLPEGYITKNLLENYNVGLLTIMIRRKFIYRSKEIFKV